MKKILSNFPANFFLLLGLIDLSLGTYYYSKLDESMRAGGMSGLDNFLMFIMLFFGFYLYGIAIAVVLIVGVVCLFFFFVLRNVKTEDIFNKETSIIKKVAIVFSIFITITVSVSIIFFLTINIAIN